MQNSKVEKNFTINCRAAEISPLLKKLFLEINNLTAFTEEMKFNLEIAAREMLANAIEHGCALASENGRNLEKLRVEITLRIEGKTLTFKVKDPGPGFDWENYDLKTMPKFEEKGRGLKMINKVTDEMEFNQAGNEIKVTFRI